MGVYAIHEEFMPKVAQKLGRVMRKCSQLGNPFEFEIQGSEIREIKNEKGEAENHRFILVSVEGTAQAAGWEFVATLEIHEGGNVIRRANNETEIPERFRFSENVCEHCGTRRNRNNLYLIRNLETGEFKQVGGNCLALYTNGLSLEYVVSWLDGLHELEEFNGRGCSSGQTYYSISEVLRYAAGVIRKTGYFNSQCDLPTRRHVSELLRRDVFAGDIFEKVARINQDLRRARFDVTLDANDFADNDAEVAAILDYYRTTEDNSEFVHNIKLMVEDGYIAYKNLGYVCYMPQGYARHIEQEKEKERRKEQKRGHFGEVGKRYKNVPVEFVRCLASFEGYYGPSYIYEITVKGGEVLTWKTATYIEDEKAVKQISFTIKEHGEYKGTPQTLITRCMIA